MSSARSSSDSAPQTIAAIDIENQEEKDAAEDNIDQTLQTLMNKIDEEDDLDILSKDKEAQYLSDTANENSIEIGSKSNNTVSIIKVPKKKQFREIKEAERKFVTKQLIIEKLSQ